MLILFDSSNEDIFTVRKVLDNISDNEINKLNEFLNQEG